MNLATAGSGRRCLVTVRLYAAHIQAKDFLPVPGRQQQDLDTPLEAKETYEVINGDQGIQKGKSGQPEQPAHPVRYKQDLRLQQKCIPHRAKALTIPAIQVIGKTAAF